MIDYQKPKKNLNVLIFSYVFLCCLKDGDPIFKIFKNLSDGSSGSPEPNLSQKNRFMIPKTGPIWGPIGENNLGDVFFFLYF